jgi:hypothetical protein
MVDGTSTDRLRKDPQGPVFFLSYARPKRPAHPVVRQFEMYEPAANLFTDLTMHVSQLVPKPLGQDAGFMDLTMEGGELWEPDLLHAVGTCSVFIALLSDPYLASEWCAMEWHAFSARATLDRSDGQHTNQTAILPVLWTPLTTNVPDTVNKVQRFHPSRVPMKVGAQYEEDGLYGLVQMGEKAVYDVLVWKLALRVQQLHSALITRQHVRENSTTLRRSFLEDSDG